MAGDKQYFYYANKLAKQFNVDLVFLSENRMETSFFKHGFCNIEHKDPNKPAYLLSLNDKIKMMLYYGKEFILNPSYINSSLFDTFCSFLSFYLIPHNYVFLFHYIPWIEDDVVDTLVKEYDWELAQDTSTSWRIGDGTAAFYNYIYYTVAGFTENNTLRSNQIREGILTRDEALRIVNNENQPRFESIKWYCDTVKINFEDAITRINKTPKLF